MPPQPPHTAKSGPEQAPPAAAARAAPDGRCGPLSSAARSRAWRRRQKIGAALVQLEIPPEALAELVERGFLPLWAWDCLDPGEIADATAQALADYLAPR